MIKNFKTNRYCGWDSVVFFTRKHASGKSIFLASVLAGVRSCIWLFFVLLSVCSAAQLDNALVNPAKDVFYDKEFIDRIDSATKAEFSRLKEVSTGQRQFFKDQLELREIFIRSLLSNGELVLNSPLNDRIQVIYQTLVTANPELHGVAKLYVLRNPHVNAFSSGSGFVFIYTGLIERAENDGNLAFVVAHELAHQYLDHANQELLERATIVNDKGRNEQIRTILKDEFKVVSKLENFLLPGLTSEMEHSRECEYQADSLGYYFFLRAGYKKEEAISMLHIIETNDEEFYNEVPNFRKVFLLDSVKFKGHWLESTSESSLGSFKRESSELDEVLKTHPDIPLRIAALDDDTIPTDFLKESGLVQPALDFSQVKVLARIESIEWLYELGNFGRAFFLCIQLNHDMPELEFPKTMISTLLSRMSIAKRNHMSGKIIGLSLPNFDEAYRRTLDFLWQLDKNDCAALGYWYGRDKLSYPFNEHSIESRLLACIAMERYQEYQDLYLDYVEFYKDAENGDYFKDVYLQFKATNH